MHGQMDRRMNGWRDGGRIDTRMDGGKEGGMGNG